MRRVAKAIMISTCVQAHDPPCQDIYKKHIEAKLPVDFGENGDGVTCGPETKVKCVQFIKKRANMPSSINKDLITFYPQRTWRKTPENLHQCEPSLIETIKKKRFF